MQHPQLKIHPTVVIMCGAMCVLASAARGQLAAGTVNDVWPPSQYVISGASVQPTSQPSAEVTALVEQLGGGPIAGRDDATNTLVGMDNSVAGQLRSALSPSLLADAADRLRSVITRMDQRSRIDPSVITLHARNERLQDVLQDLSQQLDADIVIAPAVMNQVKSANVTFDLDHASCWDAISQLEKTASLRVGINYNQLILNPAMPGYFSNWNNDLPTAIVGQFRIHPYHGTLARRIQYGDVRNPGSIEVQLQVNYEPKTNTQSGFVTCSKLELIDDHGHKLNPQPYVVPSMMSAGPRGQITWSIKFPEIADMGTRIKSLKGVLTAVIETGSKVVEFNDLPNAGQTRDLGGGASLQIKSVNIDSGYTNIELGLTASTLSPGVMRLANDPEHAFETFDASGTRLVTISIERKAGSKEPNLVWDVRVPRFTGAPKIVRVEIATAGQTVTWPFELHDIALPVPSVP